jgi:copper chaperone NosL
MTKGSSFSFAHVLRFSTGLLMLVAIGLLLYGCGSTEVKPIDIYNGDECSYCGMPIVQADFSSEIIAGSKVYKFDDLACMDAFRTKHGEMTEKTIFVMGYRTKKWLRYDNSTIVSTGIETPMGSGLVAFADSAQARVFAKAHPPKKAM